MIERRFFGHFFGSLKNSEHACEFTYGVDIHEWNVQEEYIGKLKTFGKLQIKIQVAERIRGGGGHIGSRE